MDNVETALIVTPDSNESALAINGKEKQGINVSGDTVTIKTADFDPEQRSLLRWLHGYAKDKDWSWDDIERNIGLDRTTVYRVWTGRYTYPEFETRKENGVSKKFPHPKALQQIPVDSLCAKIARKKELILEREEIETLPFIKNSVWDRIAKLCKEVTVARAIGLVYGESQIGKSRCLKQFQTEHNHGETKYVLTPAGEGIYGFMRAFATACRLPTYHRLDQTKERIIKHLRDADYLVIIDEVHELFLSYEEKAMYKVLSTLRQIQEVTRCGMVLCGTNAWRSQMESGRFAQNLKQLSRRGIWELQLEDSPIDEDLALIASHYRLSKPSGKAAEYVAYLAKECGFGKYTMFMARAYENSRKRNERFTWEHFIRTVELAEKMKTKPSKGAK